MLKSTTKTTTVDCIPKAQGIETQGPKITINNASTIHGGWDKTLLESMESAGLRPEYHCRDGHCGACRCGLVSGEIEETGFKMAYTQPDEILPCISRAKSDLVLSRVNHQIKAKSA